MSFRNKINQKKKCFFWSGEEDFQVPGDSVCPDEGDETRLPVIWLLLLWTFLCLTLGLIVLSSSRLPEQIMLSHYHSLLGMFYFPISLNLGDNCFKKNVKQTLHSGGISSIKLFLISCTPAPSHLHALSLVPWDCLLCVLDAFRSPQSTLWY